MASGSITKTFQNTSYKTVAYGFECTSAAGGTLDTGEPSIMGLTGQLVGVKVIPHNTAATPTTGFDVQLRGSNFNEDLLGGACASLAPSAVKRIKQVSSTVPLPYLFDEDVTIYAVDVGAAKIFDVEIYVKQE